MSLPEDIASAVFHARKGRKWSRLRLAEEAGVGKTVIWDIEHAKPTVRLATLEAVLGVLGLGLTLGAHSPAPVPAPATAESRSTPDPEPLPAEEELPDHLL